ncbi:hypothetical protein DXG01_010406 [Tephrocybe rancida]|nr:hypothetical protein DXG01_010406 [Tephrocybe rancida]
MSPLIRLPFIFATTYGATVSLINPNPSITDRERRPNDSKTAWYMYITTKYMSYIRGTYWLVAAAEITAILAAEGYLPFSNRILDILMPRGSINDLHLTPLSLIGTLFAIAGGWLRLKCFHVLGEFFTFEITVRDNHKLVTSGPYSVVRHPSYTGSMMIFIGLFCCWYASSGSWIRESGILDSVVGKLFVGAFTAVVGKLIVSLLQRMPDEDRLMKAAFKSEWEEWALRVPYSLIPGIY